MRPLSLRGTHHISNLTDVLAQHLSSVVSSTLPGRTLSSFLHSLLLHHRFSLHLASISSSVLPLPTGWILLLLLLFRFAHLLFIVSVGQWNTATRPSQHFKAPLLPALLRPTSFPTRFLFLIGHLSNHQQTQGPFNSIGVQQDTKQNAFQAKCKDKAPQACHLRHHPRAKHGHWLHLRNDQLSHKGQASKQSQLTHLWHFWRQYWQQQQYQQERE